MIVRTKGGGNVELYSFALTNMVPYGYQGLRSIQARFGERDMRGIPAIHRAAKLRSEAVAALRLYCWRGEGPTRDRVDTPWQAKLFRGKPNPMQTRFGFWETVEESLSFRGNAYVWKNVDGGKVVEWWALHPDQVEVKDDHYKVTVATGYVDPVGKGPGAYTVDGSTILHIRGHGQGGQLVAPSPVEVFRDALAGPVGRQRHEARMWRRGTSLQVVAEFPAGVTKDQADIWRENWNANYEGTEGATTGVIGGGATIKPIGMTMQDAQFVEMAMLTVQDASRIMGVPANLLGYSVLQRGTANLEQDTMTWLRFGLGPELERIESALQSDEQLFGITAKLAAETSSSLGLYPGFDTDDFVRGDILTEATVLVQRVQAGIATPNEARKTIGLPPDPDPNSDKLQVTPVGGAENPNLKPGGANNDDPALSRALGAVEGSIDVLTRLAAKPEAAPAPAIDPKLVTALSAIASALAESATRETKTDPELLAALAVFAERLPVATDPALLAVLAATTEALRQDKPTDPALLAALQSQPQAPPVVNVTVPEPVVNVSVNVPEQPTPIVNVTVDPPPPRSLKFKRNKQGQIDAAEIAEP